MYKRVNEEQAIEYIISVLFGRRISYCTQCLDLSAIIFDITDDQLFSAYDSSINISSYKCSLNIQTNFQILKNGIIVLNRTHDIIYKDIDKDYEIITKRLKQVVDDMVMNESRVVNVYFSKDFFPVIDFNNGYEIRVDYKNNRFESWRFFVFSEDDDDMIPHLVCKGKQFHFEL